MVRMAERIAAVQQPVPEESAEPDSDSDMDTDTDAVNIMDEKNDALQTDAETESVVPVACEAVTPEASSELPEEKSAVDCPNGR